ncbi:hypothetical protein BC643_3411 [Mangrovibacterium diazotrophicum]|uniref:Uncharacterized protein n=1 Tax=Mangrovibacterium diazotrophicum TaxID=1261403 RepID=A0A419VYH5_9BACT|nr:hypothetical protein BC643_3411 [Mangrovibacterium diazotrophicum]
MVQIDCQTACKSELESIFNHENKNQSTIISGNKKSQQPSKSYLLAFGKYGSFLISLPIKTSLIDDQDRETTL